MPVRFRPRAPPEHPLMFDGMGAGARNRQTPGFSIRLSALGLSLPDLSLQCTTAWRTASELTGGPRRTDGISLGCCDATENPEYAAVSYRFRHAVFCDSPAFFKVRRIAPRPSIRLSGGGKWSRSALLTCSGSQEKSREVRAWHQDEIPSRAAYAGQFPRRKILPQRRYRHRSSIRRHNQC